MLTKRELQWVCSALISLTACSTASKKPVLRLSELEGKKVALVEIEAEKTARSIVEVALVNQLTKRGTFYLVPKKDLEQIRTDTQSDPSDWRGLAKQVSADFALRAFVKKFKAETENSSTRETVYDSQYAEEQGNDGKMERVVPVKTLHGEVEVDLEWTQLTGNQTITEKAQASQIVEEKGGTSAIHLPPRMRFLEELTNRAFGQFFEKHQ